MFSDKIVKNLKNSSWIRAMFEEGEKLRKIYGDDRVFDFSLGNPDIEPPAAVKNALSTLADSGSPGLHRYMSNAGYAGVRERIAGHIRKKTGMPLEGKHVVMTCGAAGGMNIVLKTILNPGDEVVVLSPFFVEYGSYIDNHGGKMVIVDTEQTGFQPDPYLLKKSITQKCKAIILNSPNNPTGAVYSGETLEKIAQVLFDREKEYGSTIFILSDEPYGQIVYDGIEVSSVLNVFKNSIVINSFSKSLALPGERIGYVAVSSSIRDADLLADGLIYCNRILGYVNAPSIFQKVVAETLDESVDIDEYRSKRDLLYNHLVKLGFACIKPGGAFYLFPKALIPDDVEFIRRAVKYNILLVPGSGFGCPGYFRIAYCVSLKTIENSLPAFEALAREFR